MKRKVQRTHRGAPQRLVTAWSASRLNEYEICPGKTRFAVVEKIKLEPTEPMRRGLAVHGLGEAYLKHELKDVPEAFGYFAPELKALRRAKALAEEEYAFDATWQRLDDWFSPVTWARMKIDALVLRATTARAIDFKTGKMREKDEEQIELYALAVFAAHPEIKKVVCELWYTSTGDAATFEVRRSEEMALRASWGARAAKMMNDTKLEPVRHTLCGWCGYSEKKGGPCKVG